LGDAAKGTILDVAETGGRINEQPVLRFRIRVEPHGRSAFEATAKKATSVVEIPRIQPGQTVTVRYDPERPHIVAIEAIGYCEVSPEQARRFIQTAHQRNVHLNAVGRPALAIISEYRDLNIRLNGDNCAAVLDVKVLPAGRAPFDSSLTAAFAASGLHKYQAGREVWVKYDPQDLSVVAVDISRADVVSP
jgi:hypothetical protein